MPHIVNVPSRYEDWYRCLSDTAWSGYRIKFTVYYDEYIRQYFIEAMNEAQTWHYSEWIFGYGDAPIFKTAAYTNFTEWLGEPVVWANVSYILQGLTI